MITKYIIPFILSFSFSLLVFAASYEEGREAYLAQDYKKAISILKPLAEKGNPKAQVTMGTIYDFGHGVAKDPAQAIAWYEKAAAQGNSSVQHDLGVKYFKGQGVAQNYDKAAAWWRMAADNGVAESQYNLGIMYARGLGFKKDSAQAVKWYTKAASQGHPHAQYSLGVMYSFGQGVEQNYTKGLSYFQDSAEQNVAQAQYNLGVLLENGRGTDVDLVGAKKWYQKASDNGIEQATERLASLNGTNPTNKVATAKTTSAKPTKTVKTPVAAVPKQVKKTPKVSKKITAPVVAKKETLIIPETTIAPTSVPLPKKAPPQNHKVTSGATINQSKQSQKPAIIADTRPVKKTITKKRPKTQPKTSYPSNKLLDDVNWIHSRPPGHYALQMVAIRQEGKAREYVQKLELEGPKHIYKSLMHGRTIYKVIYGDFEDHRASLKGRRALPPKYRNAKPFPRSYKFIQNDIQP